MAYEKQFIVETFAEQYLYSSISNGGVMTSMYVHTHHKNIAS